MHTQLQLPLLPALIAHVELILVHDSLIIPKPTDAPRLQLLNVHMCEVIVVLIILVIEIWQ